MEMLIHFSKEMEGLEIGLHRFLNLKDSSRNNNDEYHTLSIIKRNTIHYQYITR